MRRLVRRSTWQVHVHGGAYAHGSARPRALQPPRACKQTLHITQASLDMAWRRLAQAEPIGLVMDVIEEGRRRGLPMGVVSGGEAEIVDRALGEAGLADAFQARGRPGGACGAARRTPAYRWRSQARLLLMCFGIMPVLYSVHVHRHLHWRTTCRPRIWWPRRWWSAAKTSSTPSRAQTSTCSPPASSAWTPAHAWCELGGGCPLGLWARGPGDAWLQARRGSSRC